MNLSHKNRREELSRGEQWQRALALFAEFEPLSGTRKVGGSRGIFANVPG